MAIVNFEQIKRILPNEVARIGGVGTANGPILASGNRATLYDPLWGYFEFGQGTSFEYSESDTYQDTTQFTIRGAFTRNAEVQSGTIDQDDSVFSRMVQKYEALASTFASSAIATAPDSFELWGTASDPRTIALPPPLFDRQGQSVQALPVSIAIDQTQFPNALLYTATLQEAKYTGARMLVNDLVLDEASLTINPSSPVFNQHDLVASAGSVLQLNHWTSETFSVTGQMSWIGRLDNPVPQNVKDLVTQTARDTVSIKVQFRGDAGNIITHEIWPEALIDQGSIQASLEDQSATVSFQGRV